MSENREKTYVLAAAMAIAASVMPPPLPRLTADYRAPNTRTPEDHAKAIERARLKRERKAAKRTTTPERNTTHTRGELCLK